MSLCKTSSRTFLLTTRGGTRALYSRTKRNIHAAQNAVDKLDIENFDVVIVGGGPAGLALASALGSSQAVRDSLRVTLVEAGDLAKVRDWCPQPGSFSNRVSSLTNTSQSFLKDIGVWDHVDISRTTPVEEIQVWDGISDARITFTAAELGVDSRVNKSDVSQMARLTENLNLQRALLRHLDLRPGVQLFDKVKVSSIEQERKEGGGGWPLVHLSDGRTLRTRLLVGADGFNSPVRSYAGISSYGWAYDTHAVVATLSHPPRASFQPSNTIAYQRFLPTGPIAFLPLSPTVSSLVWSTNPALASALVKSDPAILASMINAAFRLPEVSMRYLHRFILDTDASLTPSQVREEIAWREESHDINKHSAYSSSSPSSDLTSAGIPPEDSDLLPPLVTCIEPGTVASFPLRFNHADAYVGEGAGSRTVLVGDAAHTVHPLAGQGLNMGLGDVESLARCIRQTVLQGGDIGSRTALQPYAQERYFANHKIMSAVDKLHKLYSTTLGPVVWARSVGLEVINELDFLKAAIMMDAGAQSRQKNAHGDATGWALAAKGIETLVSSAGAAKFIGEGISGAVRTGLQNILRATASRKE